MKNIKPDQAPIKRVLTMHATVMYGAGDAHIENVSKRCCCKRDGIEIALGGAAFIEDAAK